MRVFLNNPIKKKQHLLLIGDVIIVFAVFIFSYFFRIVVYEGKDVGLIWDRLSWLIPLAVAIHIFSFYIFQLYNIKQTNADLRLFLLTGTAVVLAAALIAVVSYIFPQEKLGRLVLGFHVPFLFLAVFLWRKFYFEIIFKGAEKSNLIFFGSERLSEQLAQLIRTYGLSDYSVKAVIREYSAENSIESLVKVHAANTIVVGNDFRQDMDFQKQLLNLKFRGVEVCDFPTFYAKLTGKMPVLHISDEWLLYAQQHRQFQPVIYKKTKRLFDVIIALAGLLVAAPMFIIIALVIKLTSKGPIFFRQERLGLNEESFTLIKFRTMVDNAEKAMGPTWSSKNDPRITRIGKFLRKTRLDEIPQLLNILKGDMSFVGPRPIRKYFADMLVEKFSFYRLRFLVKPGLTGWAQVNGDYAGSEEGQLDKLEYELFYIQNQTFLMDIYILVKTIQTVLFRQGQ